MTTTRIDPSSSTPDRTTDPTKLIELIKDVRVAMFTTFPGGESSGASGLHSRPMYTQSIEPPNSDSPNRFDGNLWFMTDDSSKKLSDIRSDQTVLVTYADQGKNTYVAVYGRATAEHNPAKAKELWNIHAKGWWPHGPDDQRLVLIRVAVDSAEYWDGPSNTSYIFNLLKAVMTGERVKIKADHGQLNG